jgi:hypothetical protein
MDGKAFQQEIESQKVGNLGIPILTMNQLDVVEQNRLRNILQQVIPKPQERDWKPVKVMLPIVKQGIAAQFADEGDQLYGANSLTRESILKVWDDAHNQGKQPQQQHKIDKRDLTKRKVRKANASAFSGLETPHQAEVQALIDSRLLNKEMDRVAAILATDF